MKNGVRKKIETNLGLREKSATNHSINRFTLFKPSTKSITMSTTESVESIQSIEEVVTLDVVLASLKTFAVGDLFKLSKASLAETEKRVKSGKLAPKVEKEKKPTPKQLLKPKEWVNWVLKYAQNNGWESFTVENKKSQEIIEMPASVLSETGAHLFPDGKKMTLTLAMSLSKQYWAAKNNTGSHKELYDQFESEYATSLASEEPVAIAVAPKPKMVRKTAEEKAAEKEAAAAKKAAEKEEAAKKKAEEKEAKKVAPKNPPKSAVKTEVPVKATNAATKPGPKKAASAAWTCPDDGNVYPWAYKGENLLRNYENQVWTADAAGGCGDWKGLYLPQEDRIDDSAADPFADEE
jgi:hypothetical protein